MSNKPTGTQKKIPEAVWLALIGFFGAVIFAFINNILIVPETCVPPPAITPTIILSPTASSPTTCELADIFPQTWDCEAHSTFRDRGGKIDDIVFDSEHIRTGNYSLKLQYSNTKELAFSGWYADWSNSPQGYFNASSYSKLTFWLMGESGGETLQIGLRDTQENEEKVRPLVTVCANEWEQVVVPLSSFQDNVDLSHVKRIVFAFTRNDGSGTIFIDDIAFVP